VLESTLLYELFAWDVFVLIRHAHSETEVDLWVRVLAGGAELEHVAETLLRTVHAGDTIVVVSYAGSLLVIVRLCWVIAVFENLPSNVRQLEVNLVADVLHRRENHVVEAVSSIRALRHNECFEGHSAGGVRCVILVPDIDRDDRHAEEHEEEQQASDAEDDPLVPFARC